MGQAGTIKEISGVVQAVTTDGVTRVLVLGDTLNEGEIVLTVGSSSSVKISLFSGKELLLGGDEKSLLDNSVVSSEIVANTDVTAIQQALLNGEALPSEAPALGPDGVDGTGGITEAYIAQMSDTKGDVQSYNLGLLNTEQSGDGDVYGNQNTQINQAPVGTDDSAIATEDTVFRGNLLDNDTDDGLPNPDGDLDIVSVNGVVVNTNGNIVVVTEFGTLTINAETGNYEYLSFNDSLNIGDSIVENFEYILTDGDKTDSATLNLTLTGTNDAPTIEHTSVDSTVFESGLLYGSNPSQDGVTASGSFKVADVDGLDDITSITIGTKTFAVTEVDDFASIVGQTVATSYGSITIDSYTNGTFNYTYILTDNVHNVAPIDGEVAKDIFNIEVSDGTESASTKVTIDITDDVPIIVSARTISISEGTMEGFTGYGEVWEGNVYSVITQAKMLGHLNIKGADKDFTVTLSDANDAAWHGGIESNNSVFDSNTLESGTINGDETVIQVTQEFLDKYPTVTAQVGDFYFDHVDFDKLAEGEMAKITFDVKVTDFDGDDSTAQQVTIEVTGTNDTPVITASSETFNEDLLSEAHAPVEGNINLLDSVSDVDDSSGHVVSQIGISNSAYVEVDSSDGSLVKVEFSFINSDGNNETILVPVHVNQDGTYFVSQNEHLNKIPLGEDATGSFWYKVDDGHNDNNLSDGEEFTIKITGQNDAPEFDVTSLGGDGDIPVIVKLSSDKFDRGEGTTPKFNILVDGQILNDHPLSVEEFRLSYGGDSETSWEYVTFNVSSGTQNVSVAFLNDSYEGGSDVDGDGYSEDNNLIVDYINIGGTIEHDGMGNIQVVGGTTLQAEDTTVSTYTASNGVDVSGRETMAWQGVMTFDVENTVTNTVASDVFQTETFSEDTLVSTNTNGNISLLNGAIDIDSSSIEVVDTNGNHFTTPLVVILDKTDHNGNPIEVSVTINSNGTYSLAQNESLNSLLDGEIATGTFTFKAKDSDGGVSEEQTFTIKIEGNNDAPVALDDDNVLTLDGSGDYLVESSTVITENSSPYTVSITVIPTAEHYGYIISNGGQTSAATGMFITQGVYGHDMSVFQFGVVNENQSFKFIGGVVEVGKETTLSIVYDGDSMAVYQDGALLQDVTDFGIGRNESMQKLTIGGPSNIPNSYEYEGTVDDVQVYNQALSADEIATIQEGYTLDGKDLALHYDFEENSQLSNATLHGDASVIETIVTNEDTSLIITTESLLKNDYDVDGDNLSISSVQNGENGTVSFVNGIITFTPDADYHGSASFEYTISDGHGGEDSATVHLQVEAVNDNPVSNADYDLAAIDINYYQELKFDGDNDYIKLPDINETTFHDADGVFQGLSYVGFVTYDNFNNWSRIFDFANGAGDNNIVLANKNTSNSLVYEVWDGTNGTTSRDSDHRMTVDNFFDVGVKVHIALTHDSDGTVNLYKDGVLFHTAIIAAPTNVVRTSNFIGKSNWPDGLFEGTMDDIAMFSKVLSLEEITDAMNDDFSSLNSDNSILFNYDFDGDSPMTDKSVNELSSTVYGDPTLVVNGIKVYPAEGNVLSNDTDVDNDTLSVVAETIDGTYGTLVIDVHGNYKYTPNEGVDSNDLDSFDYQVYDGHGGIDTSTLYVSTASIDNIVVGDDSSNILIGSDENDVIFGGISSDYIDGKAGNDIIDAGDGDDSIVYDKTDLFIDGGNGTDTLQINSNTLDLSNVHNIEVMELNNVNIGNSAHTLTAEAVFDMTDSNNKLSIIGHGELDLSSDWGQDATTGIYSAAYGGVDVELTIEDTNINII